MGNVCPRRQLSEQDAFTTPTDPGVQYPRHACCFLVSASSRLKSLYGATFRSILSVDGLTLSDYMFSSAYADGHVDRQCVTR